MQLELEDLSSGRRYPLQGEAIIGRDRARTDVTLADDAISKRHARVFEEEGAWYLEDLGSSNGSFIDKLRIDRRAPLAPGDVFRLADHRFRLIEAGAEGAAAAPMSDETEHDLKEARPPPGTIIQQAHGEAPQGPSFSGGLVDGLRFFARSLPRMAVNPFGYVRRVIQEQPAGPREDVEIAAFSAVAALSAGLLLAAAVIPQGLVAAATAAVAALLAAGIAGLLGSYSHRLLRWLVDRLDGDSSPRTRTNALLSGLVLYVLSAVPSALALAAPSLSIPYLGIVAPALSFLAALVGLFYLWQWAGYFDLRRWARYLVSALGLVAVGLTGFVLVGAVMAYAGPAAVSTPIRVVRAAPDAGTSDAGVQPVPAPLNSGQATQAGATRALPEAEAPAPAKPPVKQAQAAKAEAAKAQAEEKPARAAATKPPAMEVPAATPPAESPYTRFAAARAGIEAALDRDPGLLGRDRKLHRLYSQLCREEHKIRQDFQRREKRAKPWELDKILPRQEAAERFKKTKRLVEQLSARLKS